MKCLPWTLFALSSLLCASVSALPNSTTAIGDDGEAFASLTMWEEAILNDQRSRCRVELSVSGNGTAFVAGDTIQVRIKEDDGFIGDDLIWQQVFEVTDREIELQQVTRGLDCGFPVPEDGLFNATIEIYAEVTAVKEETCFVCNYDRAQTANIDVRHVEDDGAEDNDSLADAAPLDGERFEGVASDEDWYVFAVTAVSEVRLGVDFLPEAGDLDIAMFDSDRASIGAVTDIETGAEIYLPDVEPGTYWVRIAPIVDDDFNFYDVGVSIVELDVECTPGDRQDAACGRCGTRARTCGQDRKWTPFGPCEAQGECSPGDGRVNVCANCGTITERCSSQCNWEPSGECVGSGECARGETESRECDGGSEVRLCDNACVWRQWGPCQGDQCASGDVRACYSGPQGTATVGVCESGRQVCNLGRWNACEGEVHPSPEDCDDTRDNDCDGDVDVADGDCGLNQSELGHPCESSLECQGDLVCVGPPEHPQFVEGYCGDDACVDDGDCAGGLCVIVFGGRFCLRRCEGDPDCRSGYLCVDVGDGSLACLPRCQRNSHCTDAAAPRCEVATGRCTDADSTANNAVPANNGANNAGAPTTGASGDDGCTVVRFLRPELGSGLLLFRR